MWIVWIISCLLLLVAFCLIGPGLGDSHLVNLSLCSLALFSLVIASFAFETFPLSFFARLCISLCVLKSAGPFKEVASPLQN